MFAADIISILQKIQKIQKGVDFNGNMDSRNGAWLLYDGKRECMVFLGFDSHTLYWEKAFSVTPPACRKLYDMPNTGGAPVPCRIPYRNLDWIIARLKALPKNALLALENITCTGTVQPGVPCGVSLRVVGEEEETINITALVEGDGPTGGPMLYRLMVWHEENWENIYAPMGMYGVSTGCLYPSGMKLCAELMATKGGKKNDEAITLTHYGMFGKEKNEMDGTDLRYIESNYWEILDGTHGDLPSRGVIYMAVRGPEELRRHYI